MSHWSSMSVCVVWLYYSEMALGRQRTHVLLSRSAGTGRGTLRCLHRFCVHTPPREVALEALTIPELNNGLTKKSHNNVMPHNDMFD